MVASFRSRSISMPSCPRFAQQAARTAAAFSPIPPVKTSGVECPEDRRVGADVFLHSIAENVDRQTSALITGCRLFAEGPHVVG